MSTSDAFGKDATFIVRSQSPLCGGPPLARLVERPLTWREDWFVRNHGPIPDIALDGWRLSVEGMVSTPMTLSLPELVGRLPRRDAVVTLQCAGNRRDELIAVKEIPGEVPWGAEAVSTARWVASRWRTCWVPRGSRTAPRTSGSRDSMPSPAMATRSASGRPSIWGGRSRATCCSPTG